MKVLIDGDVIVYRAGFAAQTDWKCIHYVDVVDPDDPEQDIEQMHPCAYAKENSGKDNNVEQMVEELGLHEDEYQIEHWADPQPKSYALHLVKQEIERIVMACEGYLAETGQSVSEVKIYLTGSTNFRNKVATIRGYKANRKDRARPLHYDTIRTYMLEHLDAQLILGMEADDALAIEQWADDPYDPKSIICTIDKDLSLVPGLQYNFLKKDGYYISEQQATLNFYKQLLTGDTADNIPGLYRVGQKAADKLLTLEMSEWELYEACLLEYTKRIENSREKGHKTEGYYVDDMTPYEHLLENARLLWMLQKPDQLWVPPLEEGEREWKGIKAEGFSDD